MTHHQKLGEKKYEWQEKKHTHKHIFACEVMSKLFQVNCRYEDIKKFDYLA